MQEPVRPATHEELNRAYKTAKRMSLPKHEIDGLRRAVIAGRRARKEVKIARPSLPMPKGLTKHQEERLTAARAIRAERKPNWYASKHSNVGMWNGGKALGCGRRARRACGM